MQILKVTKKATLGDAPEITIEIGGETFSIFNEMASGTIWTHSRIATATESESGRGIFILGTYAEFTRASGAKIGVSFAKTLEKTMTAAEIAEEIRDRVKRVLEAFADKYPECNEIATIELPDPATWRHVVAPTIDTTQPARDSSGKFTKK